MNSTINFSQFAYKATKPRLAFYQRNDKENRRDVPANPASPVNATRVHCHQSGTPSSSAKKTSVVPETPDDEWPVKRRGRFMKSAAATGRKKRWRIPSSSSSDGEGGGRSRELVRVGSVQGTKTGLFSSALLSKRRKRSGELVESDPNPDLWKERSQGVERHSSHGSSVRSASLVDRERSAKEEMRERNNRLQFGVTCRNDVVDLCTTASSDSDSEEITKRDVFDINPKTICNRRRQHKPATTLPPPSPDEDGWLTRRNKTRKPQSQPPSSSNSTSTSGNGEDVSRLRELFPQFSDDFLRGRLGESAGGMDEAIASILACDGPSPLGSSPSPMRPPKRYRARSRRLRLLSDDSISSPGLSDDDSEDLPVVNWRQSVAKEDGEGVARRRRGGRRLVLSESLDEDTPVTGQQGHSYRRLSVTSDSGSEVDTKGEGEREGGEEEEGEREGGGEEEEEEREGKGKLGGEVEREGKGGNGSCKSHAKKCSETVSHSSSIRNTHSNLLRFMYNKSQKCGSGGGEGEVGDGGRCEVGGGGEWEECGVGGSGDGGDGRNEEERGCEEGRGRGSEGLGGGKGEGSGGGGRSQRLCDDLTDSQQSCASLPCSDIGLSNSEMDSEQLSDVREKRDLCSDLETLEGELSDQSHYSNEEADFSEKQKTSILALLNGCSREEACAIRGCSQAKATLLLVKRPFSSWEHLLEVIVTTKGLSEQLLDGCVRQLEERRMMARLLSKCQNLSSSIEKMVDAIMEDKVETVNFTLPKMLNPELVLKPYQRVGVSWLALLHSQNLNAILADEMGLGKTVQAIAFLSHLYELGWRRIHLIVVPASTLDNWARELARWSPSLQVLTYWGTVTERADMRHEVLYGNAHYDVILSTYTICINRAEDRQFFRKLQLKTLVLDEGHMLKNMATLKYTHLMRIKAERRLLLTGTPLQNNLLELMSLLSFVMPSVFRPYLQPLQTVFRHIQHTTEIGGYYMEQVTRAKEIMRPFILRRLKKEVLHQLPDKVEIVEHCPLTSEQWGLYCREVEQGQKEMKDGSGKELIKSMAVLTNLRKAANHPLLLRNHYSNDIISTMSNEILKEAEYRDADVKLVEEDMSVMTDFELHRLCLQHQSLQQFSLPREVIGESGKFQYLKKKLIECKEQGSRMLLFSQFTMMLDIVEAWLQLLGHTHLRLDGSTHMSDRQGLIDLYNSDADILVFLLSTKAGGLGINLTSANVVVLHDIDFNPYNDKQAEDRCHRVGQTREVQVVRLVGRDTVEEEILKCAEVKLKLEEDMTTGDQLCKTDIAFLLEQSLRRYL